MASSRSSSKSAPWSGGDGRGKTLKYAGASHFRTRIVLSVLSGRPVRISKIREKSEMPGLNEAEASFIRLIDKLTNGTRIEISDTGTSVRLIPGFIQGGIVQHDCGLDRGIGYFLEGALPLCLFGKRATTLRLSGITSTRAAVGVDCFSSITLSILKHFGVEAGVRFKIKSRGAVPLGGGFVEFTCPSVRELHPVNLTDPGKIKRVRGVAHSIRCSPQFANRIVEKVRGVYNDFIPDVYINTDCSRGPESGKSPGYGVALYAESTTGFTLSAESVGLGIGEAASQRVEPEEMGDRTAKALLGEISQRGCIDSAHQWLALLLMALGTEDVSKVRLGKLTKFTVKYLRHLRDFFSIVFKITPDSKTGSVMLSCLGTGFQNMSRKVT